GGASRRRELRAARYPMRRSSRRYRGAAPRRDDPTRGARGALPPKAEGREAVARRERGQMRPPTPRLRRASVRPARRSFSEGGIAALRGSIRATEPVAPRVKMSRLTLWKRR